MLNHELARFLISYVPSFLFSSLFSLFPLCSLSLSFLTLLDPKNLKSLPSACDSHTTRMYSEYFVVSPLNLFFLLLLLMK